MKFLRRFLTRLFNSATGRAHEKRLSEEIAEHITRQTEENLRAGLSPVEARRQAMLKFGGVEALKLDYRTARGLPFIENLFGDLRNAVRTISRMPALATVFAGHRHRRQYHDLFLDSDDPISAHARRKWRRELSHG